jgi:hypothetical protein
VCETVFGSFHDVASGNLCECEMKCRLSQTLFPIRLTEPEVSPRPDTARKKKQTNIVKTFTTSSPFRTIFQLTIFCKDQLCPFEDLFFLSPVQKDF